MREGRPAPTGSQSAVRLKCEAKLLHPCGALRNIPSPKEGTGGAEPIHLPEPLTTVRANAAAGLGTPPHTPTVARPERRSTAVASRTPGIQAYLVNIL